MKTLEEKIAFKKESNELQFHPEWTVNPTFRSAMS